MRRGPVIGSMAAMFGIACGDASPAVTVPATLAIGTWGGDDAGVIVTDTALHLHVGCTFGDATAPVALDARGHFGLSGTYVLRAYPIVVGPLLPAQISGDVVANRLTFVVTVDDTVTHASRTLGPVTVTLGTTPRMGPCPICVRPEVRRSRRTSATSRSRGRRRS